MVIKLDICQIVLIMLLVKELIAYILKVSTEKFNNTRA